MSRPRNMNIILEITASGVEINSSTPLADPEIIPRTLSMRVGYTLDRSKIISKHHFFFKLGTILLSKRKSEKPRGILQGHRKNM